MHTLTSFLIILILILLNGVFVAAEFSIIGVRRSRIEQLAEEGNATAKRVRDILYHPAKVDRYIACAQLGITLASLGLGMYGEPAIAHLIEAPLHDLLGLSEEVVHTVSFFIGLGLITYLHVVLGEMIPKSLALQSAERTVFALAYPMLVMQTIFSYPITVLNKIGLLVLHLMRVPPPREGSRLHTPDELELVISDSVVGGLIEVDEQRLISNILDFAELHVHQIMIPRPKIDAIPLGITKADLMTHVFSSPHNRFPVYERDTDHIIGMIHLKDLVHLHLENTPFDLVSLLHPIPFVPEEMQADRLLAKLKKERVHMAVVVDEYGGTAGLVTLEDLIEEVVGEVRDEYDLDEMTPITVIEPGHLLVTGTVRLDDLEEYVRFTLNEEDELSETVGGLLVTKVSLPPEVGAEIKLNEDTVTLRVEAVDGLAVEQVSIKFTPESKPDIQKEHP